MEAFEFALRSKPVKIGIVALLAYLWVKVGLFFLKWKLTYPLTSFVFLFIASSFTLIYLIALTERWRSFSLSANRFFVLLLLIGIIFSFGNLAWDFACIVGITAGLLIRREVGK
jgi:hypothetical protein